MKPLPTNRMRAVLILLTLLTVGCTTSHKTYKPPNNARVVQATKKVQEGVEAARQVHRAAKTHVEDAQKSNDKLIVLSHDVQQQLDAIIKVAPAELQPALAAVKGNVTSMQLEEDLLFNFLGQAHKRQDELEGRFTILDTDVGELKTVQKSYYAEAQGLANDATNEREGKIAVEKQLIQQKIIGWIWKIGGGAVVILIIVLLFAWWAGKLAIKWGT